MAELCSDALIRRGIIRTAVAKEHVEQLIELYGRPTLEEFVESLHPEAELHQASAVPDTDDYYGRDEFLRGAVRWHQEWDTFRYLPEEFNDRGERVLVRVRVVGRASASGAEVEMTVFHLWTFREGLPWRCELFTNEERAFSAVGLAP